MVSIVTNEYGSFVHSLEIFIKSDKKIACNLNCDEIEFPVEEKYFKKIEVQDNICINVLCYENEMVFSIYVSDQKFENSMDLLLLFDDDKITLCLHQRF